VAVSLPLLVITRNPLASPIFPLVRLSVHGDMTAGGFVRTAGFAVRIAAATGGDANHGLVLRLY
jgi:hypothetical protein